MQKNTAHRKRAARGLTVLGATGMAAAGILFGAAPAHAAELQPVVFPDRVEFLGNESNHDVSGSVEFTVHRDGTWNIYSNTRNGRPAFRNVHWTCAIIVKEGSVTTTTKVNTPVVKIRRKSDHLFNVSGTSMVFAAQYETIINPGFASAHCDIHFG